MTTLMARIRIVVAAIAVLMIAGFAVPASAQSPDAAAVKEEQLLQQLQTVQGRVSIPDAKSGTLIQTAGREWREFHEVTLHWIGGIAILGMLALLIVFYLARGRIRVDGGFSGRTILRFNTIERFVHWLTAVSFIILALTGLNITFGKSLLLPLIGHDAFSAVSQWGKYAHNYLSVPFALGIVLIFLIWIKDNFPTKVDVEWLKRGGGIVGHDHPPAYRFNAGQKLIFWAVVVAGVAASVSGYYLIFPFQGVSMAGMQTAQIVHGVVGVLFAAVIIAHIYIGTLGMEGAFDAMGTGEVDVNWAKEHHSLWADEAMRGAPSGSARPSATPAE